MRENVKNKPIKWSFKFWYRCFSKRGYLCQFDFYVRQKINEGENLRRCVVLSLTKNTYCTIFYHNSFNRSLLISKLFHKGDFTASNARKNRKTILGMAADKNLREGAFKVLSSEKVP